MTTTASVAPDKGRAADQIDAAFAQLCGLLRGAPDLTPRAIGRWTARDVAAHLAGGLPLYCGLLSGDQPPAESIEAIEALNDDVVASVPEQDGPALAARIESAAAAFTDAVRTTDGDPELTWHGGLRIPLSSMAALMVEEASVHGYDVARALGRPWRIRDDWAHTVFRGLLPVMPSYVSDRAAGVRARIDVRLRGDPAARAVFDLADGAMTVHPGAPDAGVDCHVSAAPVPFLLVSLRRTSPLRPALTGQVLTWGRKPWLGAVMTSWFRPA